MMPDAMVVGTPPTGWVDDPVRERPLMPRTRALGLNTVDDTDALKSHGRA